MVERFSEIRNKEVIHVCEGSRLGYVSDCCIELETGRVTAVVHSGAVPVFGMFGRDSRLCCAVVLHPADRGDIILVDGPAAEWRRARKKRGIF